MKLKTFLKCRHTLRGLPPAWHQFLMEARGLYITWRCRTQVAQVTPGGFRSLMGRRDRIIASLCIDIQPLLVYLNLDAAKGWARCGLRDIGQCVLVSGLRGDLRIRFFHRIPREFAKDLSPSRGANVPRKNVAVTLSPQMKLVEFAVNRQGPAVDHNGLHLNAVGFKYF